MAMDSLLASLWPGPAPAPAPAGEEERVFSYWGDTPAEKAAAPAAPAVDIDVYDEARLAPRPVQRAGSYDTDDLTDAELAGLGRAIATAASRGEDVQTARRNWFEARAARPKAPDSSKMAAARSALEADRARLRSVNAPKTVVPGEVDALHKRSAAAQRRLTQLRSRAPRPRSPSPERVAPPVASVNAMAKVDSYWDEPERPPRRRREEKPRRRGEEPAYRPQTDDFPVERASHVRDRRAEQQRLQSVDAAEDAREHKARARRKGGPLNLFRRPAAKPPAEEKRPQSSDEDYEDDSDATPPPPAKKSGLFGRSKAPPPRRGEPAYRPRDDDMPAERASHVNYRAARPPPAPVNWGSDSDDEPVGRVPPSRQSAPLGRQPAPLGRQSAPLGRHAAEDDRTRRYAQRDYSQVTIGSASSASPHRPKAPGPPIEPDSDGEYDMDPGRAGRGSTAPKKHRWPWQSKPAPRSSEQTRSAERRRSSNRARAPAAVDSDDSVERLGTNPQQFRAVDAAAEAEYRRRKARSGGAEKMLRFFRPWGNKDHEAAPAPTRPGRAAFRQSPRAQGFGGGRGDDGDY